MAVIFTLLELWLLSHTGTPADQGHQGQQGQQGQQGEQGEQGEDTEYWIPTPTHCQPLPAVILVSGGEDVTSVEVFSPALQPATRCTLPKLPGSRWPLDTCHTSTCDLCQVPAHG